jgi:hypothetical protein
MDLWDERRSLVPGDLLKFIEEGFGFKALVVIAKDYAKDHWGARKTLCLQIHCDEGHAGRVTFRDYSWFAPGAWEKVSQ